MKKIIQLIVTSILVSLSCSYILVTVSVVSDPAAIMTGKELLEQVVIAAILGAVIGPLSLIFEWERIPFIAQLGLHLTAVTISVLTAGYFGGWFVHFGIKNVLISEAIIYLLIWCMMFILQKKDIAQINDAIKKRTE